MPTYLADILASHRARAAADDRDLGDLVERAASVPAAATSPARCGETGWPASPRSSGARRRRATSTPTCSPSSSPRSTSPVAPPACRS